ncbi:MAG: M23 family metallopeptidase [Acidobacteria bacterium]|nr:M23 family metallopeptidase [Acidobacteriota bacterium]
MLSSAILGSAEPAWLRPVPERVHKAQEGTRPGYEGWVVDLVVGPGNLVGIRPRALEATLWSGRRKVETVRYEAPALAPPVAGHRYRLAPDAAASAIQRRFHLDEAFDLRLRFLRPAAWAVDRMNLRLEFDGSASPLSLELPLDAYQPRTVLAFPLRGPAILTQGPVQDGGHGGYSNQFAIDVLALGPNYEPQVDDRDRNESYAGWDHPVLAPAEGVVASCRNDVPDNPKPGTILQEAWAALPDPVGAVAGNHLVIDHGNGECSVLMHLRQGSVAVKPGDRVKQGQVVGRLGSSGDSYGPHLHYQLQAGPRLFEDPSLPLRFANLPGFNPVRGVYFTPK